MTWMPATPEIPECAWGIEEPEIQLRIAGGTLHQRVLQASRLKCWSTPRQKETHICALMVTVVGSKKDSNFSVISRLCPSTWYKKPGKIPLSSCLGSEKATCCHLSVDFSHWVVGAGFRDHDRGNWLSPLSRELWDGLNSKQMFLDVYWCCNLCTKSFWTSEVPKTMSRFVSSFQILVAAASSHTLFWVQFSQQGCWPGSTMHLAPMVLIYYFSMTACAKYFSGQVVFSFQTERELQSWHQYTININISVIVLWVFLAEHYQHDPCICLIARARPLFRSCLCFQTRTISLLAKMIVIQFFGWCACFWLF